MKMKLSYKKGSIFILSSLILISLGMIVFARHIRVIGVRAFIFGPRFYPMMIGTLMIFFCVLSIIEVLKKPDEYIELENVQKPIVIFLILIAWGFTWQRLRQFYLISGIAAAVIMCYLNPESFSVKKILKSILFSVIIMVVIYLVFSVMLRIRI